MKLASRRVEGRDGELIVVRGDGSSYLSASDIAQTLQYALDHWDDVRGDLEERAARVESEKGMPVVVQDLVAPLPRAYEWLDGSAYINHIELVRKARGAQPPSDLATNPLVYQGGSGVLLAPTDKICVAKEEWGADFESELAVIMGDTPCGVDASSALEYVRLITQVNDISLRNLIPAELKKGFGFLVSKPATTFGPFAITPDELGSNWKEGRVHGTLRSFLNGVMIGDTESGAEMHFSFAQLIAHICQSRSLTAGTIIGSGTVSNRDVARGVSCLAEKRMLETIDDGAPSTPFLQDGDRVDIEMVDESGQTVFGRISQRVSIA